jgi:hypothetical protein
MVLHSVTALPGLLAPAVDLLQRASPARRSRSPAQNAAANLRGLCPGDGARRRGRARRGADGCRHAGGAAAGLLDAARCAAGWQARGLSSHRTASRVSWSPPPPSCRPAGAAASAAPTTATLDLLARCFDSSARLKPKLDVVPLFSCLGWTPGEAQHTTQLCGQPTARASRRTKPNAEAPPVDPAPPRLFAAAQSASLG